MLEEKDNRSTEMGFHSFHDFMDGDIEASERPMLTTGHTLYSDLLHKVYVGSGKLPWTGTEPQDLESEIIYLKKIVLDTFAEYFSTATFTLKSSLSEHTVEDLHSSGTISVLHDSPFEHFYVYLNTSYLKPSRRVKIKMADTIKGLLSCCKGEKDKLYIYTGSRQHIELEKSGCIQLSSLESDILNGRVNNKCFEIFNLVWMCCS